MTDYDVAITGSGPISLFEAIYQAKSGKRVVIIEERDQLGGAWMSREYETGHRYEIGCHIWDVNKHAYSFVEQYLGEKLEPLYPKPVAVWRDMKIPYDWKNNIIALRILMRKPRQFFSRNRKVKMQLIPRNYSYPKGGSEALLEKLLNDVKSLDINVLKGNSISQIEIRANGLTLQIGGELLTARKMCCSSFSNFSKVIADGSELTGRRADEVFLHFQLVIDKNKARRMSYARVLGHPFIHRVSDISTYAPGDFQVLSIGVFADKVNTMSREEVLEMIHSALLGWKWISPDAEVLRSFDNRYIMRRPDLEQREALINSGNVSFLQSTNLSYAIAQNAHRWAERLL